MIRDILINLDLYKQNYNSIKLKQLDTTNLKFNILTNGVTTDLSGHSFILNFFKSDNTVVIQSTNFDTTNLSNGIVSVVLDEDCLRATGEGKIELEIKKDGNRISNFILDVIVEQTLADKLPSENKITLTEELNNTIDEAEITKTELENVIATADTTTYATKGEINSVNESLAERAKKTELNYLNTNVNMTNSLYNFYRRAMWNQDPATSPSESYHTRNIILVGDSHGWGEGASNYQGQSAGFNAHCEWLLNDGFYGRLKKYLTEKWNSEPWRMIPKLEYYNATINVFKSYDSGSAKPHIDKFTYTKSLMVQEGLFRLVSVTKDVSNYLLGATCRNDTYCIDNYRHNCEIGLFDKYFLEFKPDTSGGTKVLAELETPTRFVGVNLLGGASQGRVKIELLDYTDDPNISKTTFGNVNYGTETPVIYRNMSNFSSRTVDTAHTINSGNIIIDCASFTGETNFIIDFKQKKRGVIKLSHDTGSTAIIDTRGIIASNFDMVKNWSLGGHTTGAFLGTEGNWNNSETRIHATDIIKYMYASAKLIVFQSPIVNEWLKQTPIATFKSNLTTLLKSTGLNYADADIIVFNTIGTMASEFQGVENTITNDMYNTALAEWCADNNVKFLDFRTYIKNMINNVDGMLYGHLYINNGHPSPIYHEIIYKNLKDAIDMFI